MGAGICIREEIRKQQLRVPPPSSLNCKEWGAQICSPSSFSTPYSLLRGAPGLAFGCTATEMVPGCELVLLRDLHRFWEMF